MDAESICLGFLAGISLVILFQLAKANRLLAEIRDDMRRRANERPGQD